MIERDFASQLHYWTGENKPLHGRHPWSPDPQRALRFARRTDAEAMLTWHCEGIGKVAEHQWGDPRAACAPSCGLNAHDLRGKSR